jgi:hypothetical protein
MTYFGKDKAPTSRIDLICTKNMGPFSAATARGPAGISATHAALGIAFTDEVHKPKTQNRTSQDAIDHVVAYMADCGGRTWSLNDKKTKQYTALCSKDSGSETRKKIEAAIHMQQTHMKTRNATTERHGISIDEDPPRPYDECEPITGKDGITHYDNLCKAILHGEATARSTHNEDKSRDQPEENTNTNKKAHDAATRALQALLNPLAMNPDGEPINAAKTKKYKKHMAGKNISVPKQATPERGN